MTESENQKRRSNEELVKELCLCNGVSYENLVQEGCKISSLEMFFSGFPRMVGLSFFPSLCQLTIVGQNVKHIEALECCPLLRELWVVQCHLKISGLQYCLQLEKLYLYENQISEINNLELQIKLEVLWLNNNCIHQIQGLNTHQNLKELNLADNNIEKIGHSLDPNARLQILNLSGNKINSIKELTMLSQLPHLTDLALKDPTSTPNPVCLLCNYATHVLYHMPHLQRLDTYDISSMEVKEAAKSTVMKKMMYYNMRVRTAQRTLAETRLSLMEKKKTMLQIPEESVRAINYALKNVGAMLEIVIRIILGVVQSDRSDPIPDNDISVTKQSPYKRNCLSSSFFCCLYRIDAWYEKNLDKAKRMIDYTIQFLQVELESVGNIRLEEGHATDPWFASCCDLLLSRFSHSDFKVHGIAGIKINRVIRIHNSALRLRFEDKLHSLLFSEENYRHQLEHLFYITDPKKHNEKEEILCIVVEGFKTVEQYKVLKTEGAIPFSNSLSVVELPKIEHTLNQARRGDSKHGTDPILSRHGKSILLILFFSLHSPQTAMSEGICRQWFVFDHELALPEYIIYFEYITEVIKSSEREQPELLGQSTSRDDTPSNDAILDKEVLSMEPVLKAQPKLLSLDDKILLNVVLNLHGNSLSKIKEISSLKSLRHLTLSFNEFTHLDDISHMPNLEFLDASYNHLVTLHGLKALGQLKQLDVRWNNLTKAREDTAVLRKHTPALLKFDTRYNPWNRPKTVRMTILGRLTTLTHLDDVVVAEEEAASAVKMAASSKMNQASILAHSRTNSDRPRRLSLLSTAQLLSLLNPITALNLDNQRISRLINLNKLVNLRWGSFNDNDISKVEGLDSCSQLEELSLNNNYISSITGRSHRQLANGNQLSSLDASFLDQLQNLSFLSVENNCISSLHGIKRVRSLRELYIGNNQISTSQDIYYLKGLVNLIILDLNGNPLLEKVENYRIYVVFHLPVLKALDGVAVEATESETAKDMFGGRLTPDMVTEKLGHSNYTDITYLTLQSCSVRIIDLCPPELFRNLHSVNLEHNNLTSFSGLIDLPNIKILCLNHNRIESILPRQKTHQTNKQMLHSKVHSSGYGQQRHSRGRGLEPLMGSLEVLHLSHNGISNMANLQLSRLTNLKALFLEDNEIRQVAGLEGLHKLRELVLDRNRIKALADNSFIAQNVIVELHLAENRIRELNHLEPLTELRKLFLGMNKLQDITELEKLDILPSLTELSVVGNPVSLCIKHKYVT
uniref:Uncharacterized protein n=1 Tax=Mola mola TaxID=94237 RepID=A0A3Q3WLU9_MOLML